MRLDITNGNPFNLDKLTFNLETVNVTDLDAVQAGFKISPNPTNGLINVELSNALQNENVQFKLLSVTGQQVGAFKINGTSTDLDLTGFTSGLYLLQLVGNNINLVHRIVIFQRITFRIIIVPLILEWGRGYLVMLLGSTFDIKKQHLSSNNDVAMYH